MNWKNLCASPNATIREILRILDAVGTQFAMVVDGECRLLGVVTDGNVRRGLIAGHSLDDPVSAVMHTSPRCVVPSVGAREALRIMDEEGFTHLPVVDALGHVVTLWSSKDLRKEPVLPNVTVLMAGGLGTRLGHLTQNMPKPMLPVGGKPMLEIVLRHCMAWGLRKFYFAVNYKASMIEDYFGDGSRFACSIDYLHEKKRLGTAGALSLLPQLPDAPCIVANGDVLSHINVQRLLSEHTQKKTLATMVVRSHALQVPYGVVDTDTKGCFLGVREKPRFNFCVNAGIYVLEPVALQYIPADTFFDMPELFTKLVQNGHKPCTFETHDYWMDVGHTVEYERAQGDFCK